MKKLVILLVILFIEIILSTGLTANKLGNNQQVSYINNSLVGFYKTKNHQEMEKIHPSKAEASPESRKFGSSVSGCNQGNVSNPSQTMTNKDISMKARRWVPNYKEKTSREEVGSKSTLLDYKSAVSQSPRPPQAIHKTSHKTYSSKKQNLGTQSPRSTVSKFRFVPSLFFRK